VRALIRQIAADGTTVFVSSHLLAEVEQICTHVGVMRTGKLVFRGSLPELRRTGASGSPCRPPTEAAAKVLSCLGLADAQGPPRQKRAQAGRRPSSATRRRSRSAPSSSGRDRRPRLRGRLAQPGRPVRRAHRGGLRCQRVGSTPRAPARPAAQAQPAAAGGDRRLSLIIGIAPALAAPHPEDGNGSGLAFFNQLAGNGVF
jgi:hypothetical protein